MLQIQGFPASRETVQPAPSLQDPSFRYQPNNVCAACRELLELGIALHEKHGRQMAEEVQTKYTFGALLESAELGCHLCALIKTGMLGVSSEQLVPSPSWNMGFSIQRSTYDDTFLITGICQLEQAGIIHRSHLDASRRGMVNFTEIHHPTPDMSRTSLGRYTGDEDTFGVAETWLRTCLAKHPLCAEHDDSARIVQPARLLSLGDTIKLVNASAAQGQEYVTLSHCWGNPTLVPRLKFETEDELRRGVAIDFLPKTFRDAVVITRRLGYRYLWIDSLCIIQDSPADWEDQAKIMALIYANSVFTIAALKSPGSYHGCFTDERNPLGLRPLEVEDLGLSVFSSVAGELWQAEVNTSGYGASPLYTRAWVVQERLSSPRTLLYGSNGIYWECRCAQASESHYLDVAWDSPRNKKTWLQKLEREDSWMEHWIDLVNTYSSCDLTMKSDKIIAVTGLISEIERRSNSHKRCILGLWSDDLPEMLLWRRRRNDINAPTDKIGRLQNDMPTWTWASVEGRCTYLQTHPWTLEWKSTAEVDEAQKPATMTIHTWTRKVLVDEDGTLVLDPDDPKTGQRGWGGDISDYFTWDCDCEMPRAEQVLFLAPIRRARDAGQAATWTTHCLVITPLGTVTAQGQNPLFTRVGVSTVRFNRAKDDPFKSKDLDAREVIVLQ